MMKPIKIVDQTGYKYAIVASSYQNLIEQAQEIFKIESVKIFTHDGARINEDYYNFVDPDTTFTVLKEDKVWKQNSKLNDTVPNQIKEEYLPEVQLTMIPIISEMDYEKLRNYEISQCE